MRGQHRYGSIGVLDYHRGCLWLERLNVFCSCLCSRGGGGHACMQIKCSCNVISVFVFGMNAMAYGSCSLTNLVKCKLIRLHIVPGMQQSLLCVP